MRNTGMIVAAFVSLALGACRAPDAGDDYAIDDTTAFAQERTAGAYAQWDADRNAVLDRNEFGVWWKDRGDRFDWNRDGTEGLTREEYSRGVLILWDESDDDRLDESEWRKGADRVWGTGRYRSTWTDWDGDGDSELDLNEVAEGLEREGLYDRVDGDRDALIDDEELADWFFDLFDTNDDREIDRTEWESTWLESR